MTIFPIFAMTLFTNIVCELENGKYNCLVKANTNQTVNGEHASYTTNIAIISDKEYSDGQKVWLKVWAECEAPSLIYCAPSVCFNYRELFCNSTKVEEY